MINITEGLDTRLFNKGNYMKFGLRIVVTVALISASAAAFAQVVDDADGNFDETSYVETNSTTNSNSTVNSTNANTNTNNNTSTSTNTNTNNNTNTNANTNNTTYSGTNNNTNTNANTNINTSTNTNTNTNNNVISGGTTNTNNNVLSGGTTNTRGIVEAEVDDQGRYVYNKFKVSDQNPIQKIDKSVWQIKVGVKYQF